VTVLTYLRTRRVRLERPQLFLLALCAFFSLVNVYLVSGYLTAARERDALATQVGAIERAVQRLQSRGTAPGVTSQAPLQPGENPFPRDLPTAELTSLVTQAAGASGARVENMTPQLGSERLAQGVYRTYKLSLRVTGTAQQLSDFLARVERGSVRSWVIDNAQAKPTANNMWDLSLDVTTYAQPV
jgi:hypothetical protein